MPGLLEASFLKKDSLMAPSTRARGTEKQDAFQLVNRHRTFPHLEYLRTVNIQVQMGTHVPNTLLHNLQKLLHSFTDPKKSLLLSPLYEDHFKLASYFWLPATFANISQVEPLYKWNTWSEKAVEPQLEVSWTICEGFANGLLRVLARKSVSVIFVCDLEAFAKFASATKPLQRNKKYIGPKSSKDENRERIDYI